MAVTEIALLRLKTPEPTSSTRKILKQAQQAQSEWSGFPVQIACQLEDSSYIYILGGWESIAHHNGDWIKSETNQKLLAQLKDDVDVEWMFHVDIDVSEYQIFSSIRPMDYSTDTLEAFDIYRSSRCTCYRYKQVLRGTRKESRIRHCVQERRVLPRCPYGAFHLQRRMETR